MTSPPTAHTDREIRFFNSMGRSLETFEPMESGRVRMYTCGPTVYNAPHIGNLRTFLFEDVLRRTLLAFGFELEHVMNLTDVEDKIIFRAAEAGLPIDEFTQPSIDAFFRDLDRLHIQRAEHYPRATDHIPEMIQIIETLLARDYAYVAEDGSVFFRIAADDDYGKLSGIDPSSARRGERVADDEYDKEDARDFVLWKAAKPGEPSWPSPWGDGRPGWHIECSAMSEKFLGKSFDIHCGGVDNLFPHHENEIAQSESANGCRFVKYWLHSEHLVLDDVKMSKSLGNQYTLDDLVEQGVDLRAVRYLLLSVHYRQKLTYGAQALEQASSALRRLDEMRFRLGSIRRFAGPAGIEESVSAFQESFYGALADDLNTSGALGALFTFVRSVNAAIDRGMSESERDRVLETLAASDSILGVLDPDAWATSGRDDADEGLSDRQIEELVAARRDARAGRDFAEADRIRDLLTERGVVLEDAADGTRWRRAG